MNYFNGKNLIKFDITKCKTKRRKDTLERNIEFTLVLYNDFKKRRKHHYHHQYIDDLHYELTYNIYHIPKLGYCSIKACRKLITNPYEYIHI